MKLLMDNMEVEVKVKVSMLERKDLTKNVSYLMSCFVELLSHRKGLMMDAVGFQHNVGKLWEGPLAHVVIPLVGKFKGETKSIHNLQVVVNEIYSKINVMWWM